MDIIRIQAGPGGAPVSLTKVLDPASKTLERSAHAESNDLGMMSTQLSSNLQSHRTSKHNDGSEILTASCLFCTNSVIIGSFRSASQIDNSKAEELYQGIRNLCCHMQMDSNKLPNLNDYTKIKFPFCTSCDALLETLRQCQKIIEAAEARIKETVFKIEKVVTVSELGKLSSTNATSSSAEAIKQKQCFPLRSMILEVIRNKFNQITFLSSSVECSSTVNQNGVDANSKESAEELPIGDQNDVGESSKESTEESPIGDQNDVGESSKESEEELPIGDQNDADESSKDSEEELPIGDQNDANKSSKDSEEELLNEDFSVYENRQGQNLQREHTELNSNGQDESLVTSPNERYHVDNSRCGANVIQNNEDFSSPQDDEDNNPGSDEMPTPITEIGNKRRKILFEDVQTVEETCSEKAADNVQCNHCTDFILFSEKMKFGSVCTRKNNPIPDLHQALLHAGEHCLACNCKTTSVVTSKPKVQISECDICERPIKGGLGNMMRHKFTHKNDAERKVALKNRAYGASKTFLSRKWCKSMFLSGSRPVTFTDN